MSLSLLIFIQLRLLIILIKNNPQKIAFSKSQILRVMTIANWNKKTLHLQKHLVNLSIP